MRLSLPRLTLVLIATALVGGVFFATLRLTTAARQLAAMLAPEPTAIGAAPLRPESSLNEHASVAQEAGATGSADSSATAALATQDVSDEREFSLEYFGHEVSLNDIGELAVPDPEFERALRAQANEYGEIEAAD